MSLAFVAGGSGGIGAAICERLAQDGWDVALTYHENQANAEATAERVRAQGRRAWVMAGDPLDQAVSEAATQGPIGAVIYASGPLVPLRHVSAIPAAQMRDQIINDTIVFHSLIEAALPHLRESRGAVVALRSAAEARFAARDVLSTAPKAAIGAIMAAIAKEEGRFGVRANSIATGLIEAGQMLTLQESGEIGPDYLEAAARATPLRRLGRADDVAEAVAFFADPARSGFITGQTLAVDGGYSV